MDYRLRGNDGVMKIQGFYESITFDFLYYLSQRHRETFFVLLRIPPARQNSITSVADISGRISP